MRFLGVVILDEDYKDVVDELDKCMADILKKKKKKFYNFKFNHPKEVFSKELADLATKALKDA